jgi:guanosine-3',5'-bis(diphosphate) 3'-pyrophosphohydrolase
MAAAPVDGLLDAIAFSARAHRHQIRKDGQTPYASHPFRVCFIVRHLFEIDDPRVLAAAVLHDTIEDTTTDCDDIIERFGDEIAGWVAALTKDKRLPDEEREHHYEENLAKSPWQVKVCKLADIYDNLTDSTHLSAHGRQRAFRRSRRYLSALSRDLPQQAEQPFELVNELLQRLEASPGK